MGPRAEIMRGQAPRQVSVKASNQNRKLGTGAKREQVPKQRGMSAEGKPAKLLVEERYASDL